MNPSFFDTILVWPIINVLVAIYKGLIIFNIPYALGFSIITLTILIRLILSPMTYSQLRASQKMQNLAPHISRIREKHKGDTKMLQQETMRLYKEHGVNPLAGCLPLLIQLPIFIALYSVFTQIVVLSKDKIVLEINKVLYFKELYLTSPWDPTFFGLPLGKNPSQLIAEIPLILLVPILTGVFQYIQSKMLTQKQPSVQANIEQSKAPTAKKEDDFASVFQKQSLYIFPVMIGFFSYTFPIGLSLYWNIFTLFGILQQYQVQKAQQK